MATATPLFGLGEVFTVLFVTLGPVKLLGPFEQQTHGMDVALMRSLTLRAFLIGLVAVLAGGFIGKAIALRWHVSLPAILITTGIIFFLVAIHVVMAPYDPVAPARPLPADPMAATMRLTFPLLVTPHGIAVVIALLAAAGDPARARAIYLLLAAVMVLNLLAMLFIRQIMRGIVLLMLQILGAVLGVLQVGLAVEVVILALRELHALPA